MKTSSQTIKCLLARRVIREKMHAFDWVYIMQTSGGGGGGWGRGARNWEKKGEDSID